MSTTKENILCKKGVRGNPATRKSKPNPPQKEQSCRGRNPCEENQRTIPLAHNANNAHCLRGHAKKRYSLRGREGNDTPTRRCHERYRDEDTQGTDTPCEDVWGTIPPRVIPTGDTVGLSEGHASHEQGSQGSTCKSFPHKSSKELGKGNPCRREGFAFPRYPWSGCHCGNQGRVTPTGDTVGLPDRYSQVKKKTTRKSEGWYVNLFLNTSGSKEESRSS